MCNRFPQDETALDIDKQFFWGSALLIAPILEEVSLLYCYFAKKTSKQIFMLFNRAACL